MSLPDMRNCNDTPSMGPLTADDFAPPMRLAPLRRRGGHAYTRNERIAHFIAGGVALLLFVMGAVALVSLAVRPAKAEPVEVDQPIYLETWA